MSSVSVGVTTNRHGQGHVTHF